MRQCVRACTAGPAVSYFQDEYVEQDELFPIRTMGMYDLELPIPNKPVPQACARAAKEEQGGGGRREEEQEEQEEETCRWGRVLCRLRIR